MINIKSSEILKNYRKNQGLTVAKFAEMLGISQVFLTHLEHDKRKISESLFERLEGFLSKEELDSLKETEKMKDLPEDIIKKIVSLEKENKDLKEKFSQIDPRVEKLNKREFNQYEKAMNEASLFFNDETTSEEDKQKLMLAISEMFFMSKEINRKKYARKDKKKEENK